MTTILRANLKHFYQRRSCWLMHLLLGLLGVGLVAAIFEADSGLAVLLVAFWMYLAAIFVSQMQIEVLVMPFSWCLPGHREETPRLLFAVGIVLSCAWSGIYMLRPELGAAGRLGMGLSVFFVASGAYFLAAWIVFWFSNITAAVALTLIVLALTSAEAANAFSMASGTGWLVGGLLGGLIDVFVWRTLDVAGFARKYCGLPTLQPFDTSPHRAARFNEISVSQKKAARFRVHPTVERFFVRRIRHGRGMAQCVWGNLYTSEATVKAFQPKQWAVGMLLCLGLACYYGYKMEMPANFLFILPAVFVVQMQLGIRSSLLIRAGRKERFWSALTLAIAACFFATAYVALIAGVTLLVQVAVPELSIRGQNMVFHAMDMTYMTVPLAVVPVVLTVRLILCNHPSLTFGGSMLVMFVAIPRFDDLAAHPVMAAGIAAACWLVFAAVLRLVCMRGRLC